MNTIAKPVAHVIAAALALLVPAAPALGQEETSCRADQLRVAVDFAAVAGSEGTLAGNRAIAWEVLSTLDAQEAFEAFLIQDADAAASPADRADRATAAGAHALVSVQMGRASSGAGAGITLTVSSRASHYEAGRRLAGDIAAAFRAEAGRTSAAANEDEEVRDAPDHPLLHIATMPAVIIAGPSVSPSRLAQAVTSALCGWERPTV